MKKCKIIDGEILLPEPMIQHIQSFLTGREAARTTVLSKSWYIAWLTRPTFDFSQYDFKSRNNQLSKTEFAEVTTKSMQRYQDLNMKIDRLRLVCNSKGGLGILSNKLVVSALQRGATEVDLESSSILPREVLESEQLVRLSLNMCKIDGSVRCWRLKSLILHRVHLESNELIRDILSSCLLIEELSLSLCTRPSLGIRKHRHKMIDLSGTNMFKLHKLRRLVLKKVRFNRFLFSDSASRFPCLKDLSISECCYIWSEAIQIASTSLESISFVRVKGLIAEFDVPNLVSFRYSGEGIPSLCIESSREWESDVSIKAIRSVHTHSNLWYLRLKKLLAQLSPSKISLCISREVFAKGDRDLKAVSKPLVVENLTIDPPYHSGYTILSGLLSICRPKFLTIYWLPHRSWYPRNEYHESFVNDLHFFWYPRDESSVNSLCKRLIKEIITQNCEISDQNMFGQLGLKEASVEIFEENLEGQWQPLLLNEPLTTPEKKRKLRFQLRLG